jgi:hypothetical protein
MSYAPEKEIDVGTSYIDHSKMDSHAFSTPSDDIHTHTENKPLAGSSSSLRKGDVESNETDIKVEKGVEGSDVASEEDANDGKVKQWVARNAKGIRIGIHAAIFVVMTG